ncbi:MAG: hypothetical protein AB7F19_03405 [Candidatus Babeliales bacterium]
MYGFSQTFHYLISLCCLLLLAGCGARAVRQEAAPIPLNYTYTMHVEGVECRACANAVLTIVRRLPGVTQARYHTADATYHESYITFTSKELLTKEQEEQLKVALAREEFTLLSLINSTFGIPNQ